MKTNILLGLVLMGIMYLCITNTIIIRQNKANCIKIISSMPSEPADYSQEFEEIKDKIDEVNGAVQDCDYDISNMRISVSTNY